MDFDSLPRRALQLLCKRNRIPANTTNVAMAKALHSLQTVEGLDEIDQESQTPIITTTRSPNPPRSCRKNSTLTSAQQTNTNNMEKRALQGLLDSLPSKRSRALSSKKKEEEEEEEEADPIEKPLPCMKTHCSTGEHCSVKPMLRCSSSVRRNSAVFESAESAAGVVGGEANPAGEEKRGRSIGVQVDIGDEIVASIDPRNSVEFSRCLEVNKKDYSCIFPTKQLVDKECINSSALQSPQAANQLPEKSPKSSSIAASQQTPLLEIGSPTSGSVELNCDPVMGNSEDEKDMVRENEETNMGGGTRVGIKLNAAPHSPMELNRYLDLVEKDQETTSSLFVPTREVVVAGHGSSSNLQNIQAAMPEQSRESLNMPSIIKSHEPVVVNITFVHGKSEEDADMGRHNEEGESGGGTMVEIKTERRSETKSDLSGLSLRKLRLLYKENKKAIKSESKEGEACTEEENPTMGKAKLDGLSLRKLKFLYKNKVNNNGICEVCNAIFYVLQKRFGVYFSASFAISF